MNIALITYGRFHVKSFDILCGIKASPNHHAHSYRVFCGPWKESRKRHFPIMEHRPKVRAGIHQGAAAFPLVAESLGFDVRRVDDWHSQLYEALRGYAPDRIFLLGAGLIKSKKVLSLGIINFHPGILKHNRGAGLDAVKWAFYHDHEIGTTVHYIDENVDCGNFIAHHLLPKTLPPMQESIGDVYRRAYELEIETALDYCIHPEKVPDQESCEVIKSFKPTKRMPANIEHYIIKVVNWNGGYV